MGGYLLDTHTAIWFFNGDAMLSAKAQHIVRNRSNAVYLSIVSAWEVAIKLGIGKLDIAGRSADFIHDAESNEIIIIPIKTSHLTTLESLPLIHRDPFDRLLVATAISEQMTFITADKNIAQYDVPLIW
jgi:PIN domain nuclease of toxin-antitoxin system